MTTFSLSVTGVSANSPYQPKDFSVPDADVTSNVIGTSVGAQGQAMRLNNQMLCKGPDGALRLYTIDPVRSIPGVSLVLLPVGP